MDCNYAGNIRLTLLWSVQFNQSITACVYLPKDTGTSVQVILLCHIKDNKI